MTVVDNKHPLCPLDISPGRREKPMVHHCVKNKLSYSLSSQERAGVRLFQSLTSVKLNTNHASEITSSLLL